VGDQRVDARLFSTRQAAALLRAAISFFHSAAIFFSRMSLLHLA